MALRPLARRAALAIGGAALLSTDRSSLARADDSAALGQLWATAVDGMINVPGCDDLSVDGVLYMAPAASVPPPRGRGWLSAPPPPPPPPAWPRIFSKGVVYSLTASNPLGADAPAQWNREANRKLEADIKENMPRSCIPRAWWRSFGFNPKEGWREDGFSLAFASEERVFARAQVLRLAHKYRQAAIYAYSYEGGELMREVVWLDPKAQPAGPPVKERMVVLREPPASPMAAKGWRPPEGGPDEPPPPKFSPEGRNTSIWSLKM